MKSKFFSAVLVLAVSRVFADSMFWTYPQEVTAEFSTEAEAQAATAEPDLLPPGKTYAFSARWDDTNPAHAAMSDTLASQGFKGTFYHTRVDDHYVRTILPRVLKNGCSIGSHTESHPFLGELLPNCAFNEIMQNRVNLETASQTPVVAFTLPFGNYTSDVDPGCAFRIGRMLLRAGLLGTAEYSINRAAEYGLSPEQFSATRNFSINDKDPQQSLFTKNIEESIRDIAAGKFACCGPHFTLGTHSWQGKEGLVKLGGILATYARRPEIWYCNENEYNARWMQRLHTAVKKSGVKGKTAVFTLDRVMPFQLGANEAMTLRFSVCPVSVRTTDKTYECASSLVSVPHALEQSIASLFLRLTDQRAEDGRLPGFRMDGALDAQGVLTGKILNKSGHVATSYYLTLRPSICWTSGVQRVCLDAKGKEVPFRFALGGQEQDASYAGGTRLIVLQCDFRTADGLQCRAYRTLELPPVAAPAGKFACKAFFAGPILAEQAGEEQIRALSAAGVKRTSFGDDICAQWYPVQRPANCSPAVLYARSDAKGWETRMRQLAAEKEPRCVVYAIDFKIEKRHIGLHTILLPKSRGSRFYLDGRVVTPDASVDLAAGPHRLVLVNPFTSVFTLSTAFKIQVES